ncbi:hypothetical protein JCM11491_001482 [Sporobolomyces phaffii]
MNAFTSTLRTTLRGVPSFAPAFPSPASRFFSSSALCASSKLDDVLKQVQANPAPRPSKSHSNPGRAGGARGRQSIYPSEHLASSPSHRTYDASPFARPTTPDEIWTHQAPVAYSPSVTTTSARSFAVQQGNVARAFRNLNRVLNENQVRRELRRQERFESPSNKRVRLNSERHRRRFKVAVGKAVSLAMRMKDL